MHLFSGLIHYFIHYRNVQREHKSRGSRYFSYSDHPHHSSDHLLDILLIISLSFSHFFSKFVESLRQVERKIFVLRLIIVFHCIYKFARATNAISRTYAETWSSLFEYVDPNALKWVVVAFTRNIERWRAYASLSQ